MLEPIVGFFDKLIDQFTWRRLIFLAIALIICSMATWAYESYTQSFKLSRIEKQVNLLDKLSVISSRPEVKSNAEILSLARSITRQLQETDITAPASYELLPWFKKAMAAALAWLVFGFFVVLIPDSYTKTQPATGSVVAGMTVVASPFIALATAMPTNPWINYAIFPIGHIFILAIVLTIGIRLLARKMASKTP